MMPSRTDEQVAHSGAINSAEPFWGDFPPLSRPYPQRATEGAWNLLRAQGQPEQTVQGAESVNTPLWQRAVWVHLSDDERAQRWETARAR